MRVFGPFYLASGLQLTLNCEGKSFLFLSFLSFKIHVWNFYAEDGWKESLLFLSSLGPPQQPTLRYAYNRHVFPSSKPLVRVFLRRRASPVHFTLTRSERTSPERIKPSAKPAVLDCYRVPYLLHNHLRIMGECAVSATT